MQQNHYKKKKTIRIKNSHLKKTSLFFPKGIAIQNRTISK